LLCLAAEEPALGVGVVRFDDDGNIWVRQSWLSDAIGCPERGRRKIVQPEWDWEGDAAAAGTAAHSAAQACLEGEARTVEEVVGIAAEEAKRLINELDIAYKSFDGPTELISHAIKCAAAWFDDILPRIRRGGLCEVPFQVVLFEHDSGRQVGIEGTIDYLPPIDNQVEDWKNPGRKYDQQKKQAYDIQSTVYCTAAVKGALCSAWEERNLVSPTYEWPMTFRFGSAVRGAKQAKGQIVEVKRFAGHEEWLKDQLNRFVNLALGVGFEREWPCNDENWLCSEKWCPWWSDCKGARLHWQEIKWKPAA
jgi:hypothetical protein